MLSFYTKASQVLRASLSFNNNLYGLLVSSLELPDTLLKDFMTLSVALFVSNFTLISCELDLIYHIGSFYIDSILKIIKFTILSQILLKNSI